jgi:AcrR family transcriptional regulator
VARRGLDAEQVTDAAVAVADADGLAAVTIARVAADLGVRAPSLYNHVASRGALIEAVARRGYAEATAALQDAAVGRSGPDAIRAVAIAYRAYAHAAPGRYAATQRALPGEPGAAAMVAVMSGALRGWKLQGDEEIHAIRALRSALHGFVILELGDGFAIDLDLDESYARLVETLIKGLGKPGR